MKYLNTQWIHDLQRKEHTDFGDLFFSLAIILCDVLGFSLSVEFCLVCLSQSIFVFSSCCIVFEEISSHKVKSSAAFLL